MPLSLLLHSEDQGGGGGKKSAKDRLGSQDTNSVQSISTSTNASHAAPPSWFGSSSATSRADDEAASWDAVNVSADNHNPMFPAVDPGADVEGRDSIDEQGRKKPAALPSYLKIPTLIPSAYASPTSSASPSPPIVDESASVEGEAYGAHVDATSTATTPQGLPRLRLGSKAAEAILTTQDVVLAPGEAGRVSSPLLEDPDSSQDTEHGPTRSVNRISSSSNEGEALERTNTSRTSTPTPGDWKDGRTMTPTENKLGGMSAMHAHSQDGSDRTSQDTTRRPSLQLYTGSESGYTTPALPIGLRSAPSSALTPAIPTYGAEGQSTPSTPLTKETNNLNLTLPQTTPTAQVPSGRPSLTPSSSHGRPSGSTAGRASTSRHVHLVPIQVVWRGGGKEVFVTGTFANEWRSKILLRKSPTSSGRRQEYSCVLHLAPGTHRLKFIVDDRWRVSRDLPTASDGEGNLTNYIEVAHTGPAHPGPLSAPGEDMLAAPEEEENVERNKRPGLSGHKATGDLIEEARRAEALQRGNLLDVFGDDNVQKEERWTQEIPPSVIKAQAAEESQRNEEENQSERAHHRSRENSTNEVPVPPALPRQLEKVILNSTSASVLGTVDDNSVLPAPNHAVLQHLTASAIRSGVIATGCTVRYRRKYITTVYYRAAS